MYFNKNTGNFQAHYKVYAKEQSVQHGQDTTEEQGTGGREVGRDLLNQI